ncbi:MAG: alpha-galactosidase [Acidobacteriota bacterium]|nr:MAG: alpha-galactosidase [Acidobacteriota bacterium]
MKSFAFYLSLFFVSIPVFSQPFTTEIQVQSGERWWAGIISESHLMPLDGSPYKFDFYANVAGNQAQPLLISNRGRFIWCDEPFRFEVREGKISAASDFAKIQTGQFGETLKSVYQQVSRTYFPPSGKIPDPLLFTQPQFNTWIEFTYNQNQVEILDYAEKIVQHGFPPGVFMIDEGWAVNYGNWEFDRSRFGDPKSMVDRLHELGFKVMLWVCPYISPNGPFYKDLQLASNRRGETVWIVNRDKPSFPAIMQWWDGFSAVVDLSNPTGRKWFKGQLDHLISTYGIDGFKFDGGDAPHYAPSRMLVATKSYREDITPNGHTEEFVRLGLEYPMNEYRACWKMGGQPIAQRLRDKEHNWTDLQKLIPGIINQGLMGYPFNCPDLIGGGEYLSFLDLAQVDQELIVRAAQTHALMPMMQFSVAPWRVLDEENLAITVKMAKLHSEFGTEILTLARESAETGEPIVRSLEYEYPHQGYVEIDDQFLLGESILVAPVVEKGVRRRNIVFPSGTWKGDDGTTVKGPTELEVAAPLERLPWYRKID